MGRQVILLAASMLALGCACAAAFMILGVRSAAKDQALRLEKRTDEIVQAVQTTWHEYETVALWIHHNLRTKTDYSTFWEERRKFEILYQYIHSNGLQVEAISYLPNITHDLREDLEAESAAYYQQVDPSYKYQGFTGLVAKDPGAPGDVSLERRPDHPFYFPQLLVQPIVRDNEFYIDLDFLSTYFALLMTQAFEENLPIISNPFPHIGPNARSKGNVMFLVHPGVPIVESWQDTPTPNRAMASVLFSFSAFIQRATQEHAAHPEHSESIYIFDTSTTSGTYVLFGAADLTVGADGLDVSPQLVTEPVSWDTLHRETPGKYLLHRDIQVAQQIWKVVVVTSPYEVQSQTTYPIVGGVIMLFACFVVVGWYLSHTYRDLKLQRLKQATEAEKASLIVQHAAAAADAERQRNEYLAHEVRNPLSSALSACSFVGSALSDGGQRLNNEAIVEDVNVIKSSLTYINDLLRSMLDVNKVASKQMVLDVVPTDLYRDVFEPVKTIISRRENPFTIVLDVPSDLLINTDRMRLKQVVLNLASNAAKFVDKGFIRLSAKVLSSKAVVIAVEDSGPGIPEEKVTDLFARFQLSLDVLNQGTGMGLHLCQGLVELMGGTISLDSSYDSGIRGCPGARFEIELPPTVVIQNTPAATTLEITETKISEERTGPMQFSNELPEGLNVLLVDDDTVLRKLLSRSLKRVAPTWTIREAANGETALSLVRKNHTGEDAGNDFDLIFMDHYMASVERQMLGTETTQAMRHEGVKARICGLSANDRRNAFISSGADHFMLKPFSSEPESLKADLVQALGI
uniref:histidine kinase n=1 Tax=Amphora coffeiformis TaxID=265554 RepID=A0A7S3L3M9_9STRA